jgi:hypothetical protein
MKGTSNEEIIAVAEGSADREMERRVTAVALLDSSVRARLREAKELQEIPLLVSEQDGGFATRAQRLKEAMEIGARRIVREHREAYESSMGAARAGPSSSPSPLRRVLDTVRQGVTLPCLAPASAASVAELSVRRDMFLVEGVRIELQQLPGEPPRVRAFGDASGIPGGFSASEVDGLELTLEELGTILISLNAEGHGYLDFVVGEGGLPTPRRAVRLTEVALIRRGVL